jgi:hypothetical protein
LPWGAGSGERRNVLEENSLNTSDIANINHILRSNIDIRA